MQSTRQARQVGKRALESADYARQGYGVAETAQIMACSVANVKALRVRFIDSMYSRNMPQAVCKAQTLGLFTRIVVALILSPLFAGAVSTSPDQNNDQARMVRRVRSRREFDLADLSNFLNDGVS